MLALGQGLKNLISNYMRPVGTYYDTSDTSFNPNTHWYGTWVEETDGRVLVSLDTSQTEFNSVGKTGGSKLLQSHNHRGYHFESSGYAVLGGNTNLGGGGSSPLYGTDLYKLWGSSTGEGNSQNLQPYKVIKRWHRTE